MIFSSSKTPGTLVAEIEMLKTTHTGGFLVVEGDDDSLFWRPRTNQKFCEIVIAGGKPNVIGAAIELDKKSDKTTIGCYDADFENITGTPIPSSRLARTVTHDLELMLLSSGLLDQVLAEICDYNKIKCFETSNGLCIADQAIVRAVEFGKLRFINEALSLNVSFEKLSPYKYIDHTTWQTDIAKLKSDFCAMAGMTTNDVDSNIASLVTSNDSHNLAQGHDALKILAIGLKGILGGNSSYSDKNLASMLRMVASTQYTSATQLFIDLVQIDKNHTGLIF